jgi:hypothetical protein
MPHKDMPGSIDDRDRRVWHGPPFMQKLCLVYGETRFMVTRNDGTFGAL